MPFADWSIVNNDIKGVFHNEFLGSVHPKKGTLVKKWHGPIFTGLLAVIHRDAKLSSIFGLWCWSSVVIAAFRAFQWVDAPVPCRVGGVAGPGLKPQVGLKLSA